MKFSSRAIVTFCIAAVLTAALVHFVPSAYLIQSEFEWRGHSSRQAAILAWLRNQGMKLGADTAHCLTNANLIKCTFLFSKRSLAGNLEAGFRSESVTRKGHVPPSELLARIESARREIDAGKAELATLQAQMATFEQTMASEADAHESARRKREQLDREIANRNSQLKIIDDALKTQTDPLIQKKFEEKREELKRTIQTLDTQLTLTNEAIERFRRPEEFRRALENRVKELDARIPTLQADISRWEAVVRTNSSSELLEDPDDIQLEVRNLHVDPKRSVSHVPWSFILGILAVAIFFKRVLPRIDSDFITSIAVVEKELKLKYLGPLP